MLARISAFVVWALVAAAAVFWVLRFTARPAPVPAHAVPVADSVTVAGDLSRLLGRPVVAAVAPAAEAPAAPPIASRLRLVGVMAPKAGRPPGAGLAMIALDGKPARPYVPGATIDGDVVLQSVGLRTAAIGPAAGAPLVTLEVPRLAAPATGALPPVAGGAGGVAPPPVVPQARTGIVPQLRPTPPRPPAAPVVPDDTDAPVLVPPPQPNESGALRQ